MNSQIQETETFLGRVDTPETELDIPIILPLDEETRNMCIRNGLLPYIQRVDDEIIRVYKNVIAIKHRVLDYGDIPKEERLRFEIHLTGEPEEILKDEKKFHTFLFNQIPEEKQHFFSLTYRIP